MGRKARLLPYCPEARKTDPMGKIVFLFIIYDGPTLEWLTHICLSNVKRKWAKLSASPTKIRKEDSGNIFILKKDNV